MASAATIGLHPATMAAAPATLPAGRAHGACSAMLGSQSRRGLPAESFNALRQCAGKLNTNRQSASRSATNAGPSHGHVTEGAHVEVAEELIAGSDPLPLVARTGLKSSPSQEQKAAGKGTNVIDWFASERARDVLLSLSVALPPIDWPMFRKQKRRDGGKPVDAPLQDASEGAPAETGGEEGQLASSASNGRLYPRSAWPRRNGALSRPGTDVPAPRCNWPRVSSSTSLPSPPLPGSLAAGEPATCHVTATAASIAPAAALAEATSGTAFGRSETAEQEIASLERLFAFTPHDAPGGAHCAWPRKGGPQAQPLTRGPHCAWPRGPPALQAGARSAWPQAVPGQAAGSLDRHSGTPLDAVPTARCAWPRKSHPPQSGDSPRCAWPRASSLHHETAAGPRCAWPRGAAPSAALSADMVRPPPAAVGQSPRCDWPRKGARMPAATQSPLASSPRCDWPRQRSATAHAVVAASTAAGPSAPRCEWPRQASGRSDPALTRRAEQQAAEAGPRCALPRPSGRPGTAWAGGVAELPAPVGPRCDWPRAGHVVAPPAKDVQVRPRRAAQGGVEGGADDAAWNRRLVATTVCIGLISEMLVSRGGSPLSGPLAASDGERNAEALVPEQV